MQCHPHPENHERQMYYPKPHNGLFFTPAFELKMVVQRRHAENAAAEKVAAGHLDDDGDGFDVEHEAEKE